jgi:hypothetical protein
MSAVKRDAVVKREAFPGLDFVDDGFERRHSMMLSVCVPAINI